MLQFLLILWLATYAYRTVPILKPLQAPYLKGLRSVLVSSTTMSFWWLYIKSKIGITTG